MLAPTYFQVRRFRTEVPDHFNEFPLCSGRDELMASSLRSCRRILEVGAGDRTFQTSLHNWNGTYKTMDLERGQKHDFYSISEINEPFDGVVMREVVEHLTHEELFAYLDKLSNIISPGGVLVLSTPNPWAAGTVFAYDYTHISPWNMRDIYGVIRHYGFDPVKIYRIVWPSRLMFLKKAYWAIHSRLYMLDYAGSYVAIAHKAL